LKAEESPEPRLRKNRLLQRFTPAETLDSQPDLGPRTSDELIPTWPEVFPIAEIEKQRQLVGEAEFARMFLLDLRAAEGVNLKADWLHEYPQEKVSPSWPVVMGVDYASTADAQQNTKRDYFAVAIGRALPGGAGVVLVDGYRGRVSQGEAEQHLKALAAHYPTTQLIGVEAVGKGEEFYHLLLRSSLLPVMPMQPGNKGKGLRFEKGMAPLFQFGRAWLADVETPFLRAFREEWLRWPKGEHDDTLDAVYWMLYAARHHVMGTGVQKSGGAARRRNPFTGLGRG
jgi:phage terminase large subunit-like protein